MVFWILFLVMGALVTAVLAFSGTSMFTADIAKVVFIAFLILLVGSVLGALFRRGGKPHAR